MEISPFDMILKFLFPLSVIYAVIHRKTENLAQIASNSVL